MNWRATNVQLGAGALLVALLMALVVIPAFVSSPSNVPNPVLSPLFWPYALSLFTGLVGLGLLATSWGAGVGSTSAADPAAESASEPLPEPDDRRGGMVRLAASAAIMLAVMALMRPLGMVWTSMLAFAALALLVRTPHPRAALLCAVLVPLVLYAFFAHVAGISIPQGTLAAEYVRLP